MFVAIKDVLFLTPQAQEHVLERITTRKTLSKEQENSDNIWNLSPAETEDWVHSLECFQRNSAGSACPNAAKGIFASSEEVGDLLKHLW